MRAHLVLARPLDVCAELGHQRHHRLNVADARDVVQHHRFAGQQARGEDREGAVLVAGRLDPPAQRPAALDHEGLGERVSDERLGHTRGLS